MINQLIRVNHGDKKNKLFLFQGFKVERVMGIEPTQPAWEAGTLPLSYTRPIQRLFLTQPLF
jgi:hypothetical protein